MPPSPVHAPAFLVFYNGPESESRALAAPLYDLGPMKVVGGPQAYTQVTGIYKMMKTPDHNRVASSSVHLDYPLSEKMMAGAFNTFLDAMRPRARASSDGQKANGDDHRAKGDSSGNANSGGDEPPPPEGDEFSHSMLMLDLRDYTLASSIPSDATAYSHRWNTAMLAVDMRYDDPALDDVARANTKKVTGYIKDAVRAQRLTDAPKPTPTHTNGDPAGANGSSETNGGVTNDADNAAKVNGAVSSHDLRKGNKILHLGDRDFEAVYPNVGAKDERLENVFGSNLGRMREVKRKYDPEMLWDKWYPVTPAEG